MRPIAEPPLDETVVRARAAAITARLRLAAERAGRDPDGFRIVAVSKGFGLDVVRIALRAGLERLGENRVQEALPKVEAAPRAEWHLIGHLQSNKVRRALEAFPWIHSVDSVELLRRIESIAHDEGRDPRLLLQVNLSGEETKSGWDPGRFAAQLAPGSVLAAEIRALRHARVAGLMTIARAGLPDEEARATFAELRRLRDRLEEAVGEALPELSMGMTADADAAVAEGATLVRLGTALFGPRPA